jgi:GTPase Era involved in 16S rRNA processing
VDRRGHPEKLLERTRQELPFASAVLVESVREETEKNLTVVVASIVVEKEGQKESSWAPEAR